MSLLFDILNYICNNKGIYQDFMQSFIKNNAMNSIIKKQSLIDELAITYCVLMGYSFEQIKAANRHQEIANARHVLCYFLVRIEGYSNCAVGRAISRHNATVINSIYQVEAAISFPESNISLFSLYRQLDLIIFAIENRGKIDKVCLKESKAM